MNRTTLSLKYGVAAAVIMTSAWWLGNLFLSPNEDGIYDFGTGEILGYAAMLLAFTAVFIGIKSYRDSQLQGAMSFKQGLLTGLGIVLVASIIYVMGWMIYYPIFMPDFAEQYQAYQVMEYREAGLNAEEIEAKVNEMAEWAELYENPLIIALFTFLEVFPIGAIVAIVSALILKRK